MAVESWTNLAIYVGQYSAACNAKSVDAPSVTVTPLDVTALCDTWTKQIAGLKEASWTAELMQDFAADEVDQLVGMTQLSTAFPFSVVPGSSTAIGDVSYTFRGRQFEYTPFNASVGDIAMASISGFGDSSVVRGVLLTDRDDTVTSTGTGTATQIGALSAGQSFYCALHVLEVSGGSPSMDFVVASDDNAGMTSATTRVSQNTITEAGSYWLSTDSAGSDDYWRPGWTISGSTPSFTFAIVAGIAAT